MILYLLMAEIKYPPKDKLICGIIFNLIQSHDLAIKKLNKLFGEIDLHLENHIEFNFTEYYYKQMGKPLFRCFISFKVLIDPAKLAEIKILTNKLEEEIKYELLDIRLLHQTYPQRLINLDPGLLNPSRLVLASTKNYSHRIYLSNGIYAELELLFDKNGAKILPWTYQDYKTSDYQNFFIKARNILLKQLRNK